MQWLDPLARLGQLILPSRCPGCGAVADADHRFCAACWNELRFLGPPWCATCHVPFEFDRGTQAQCAACIAAAPEHDGVRAAVAYGKTARELALRLKYGGRVASAETMARAMARLMPVEADLMVPVPLHRWRIWSRGFNQAALIASALSRITGVPTDPLLLRRTKATAPLRGLGARARARAVAGAFAVDRDLRGMTLVLVDDVYTSGATAAACVRTLKRAGASRVILLCWARVLADQAALD